MIKRECPFVYPFLVHIDEHEENTKESTEYASPDPDSTK